MAKRKHAAFSTLQQATLTAEADRLEISFTELLRRIVDDWIERKARKRATISGDAAD